MLPRRRNTAERVGNAAREAGGGGHLEAASALRQDACEPAGETCTRFGVHEQRKAVLSEAHTGAQKLTQGLFERRGKRRDGARRWAPTRAIRGELWSGVERERKRWWRDACPLLRCLHETSAAGSGDTVTRTDRLEGCENGTAEKVGMIVVSVRVVRPLSARVIKVHTQNYDAYN